MTTEIESMAVEMPEVEGHPNRTAFRGVLTVVDAASTRAPSGAKGHRVILSRAAAEAALPSLIGMALDFAPSFEGHDERRKVGVITHADIVGRNLEVGGYLYAKDFPEIVDEIQAWGGNGDADKTSILRPTPSKSPCLAKEARHGTPQSFESLRMTLAEAVSRLRELTAGMPRGAGEPAVLRAEASGSGKGPLGMSYEVTEVSIADERAHVWILNHVTFTGAAILRRDRAAYAGTWIGLEE